MGLYKKHSNEVVEVETCYIHCEIGQKIYASLQELLKNSPLRVFNPEKRKGFLRHLLIRTAVKTP